MRRFLAAAVAGLCLLLAGVPSQARASWLSEALHGIFDASLYGPYGPYGPGYGYPPWAGGYPYGYGGTYVQTYSYPPPYAPPVPYGPVPYVSGYYSPYYNAWRRHQWHEWREHGGGRGGYGYPVWHHHHD